MDGTGLGGFDSVDQGNPSIFPKRTPMITGSFQEANTQMEAMDLFLSAPRNSVGRGLPGESQRRLRCAEGGAAPSTGAPKRAKSRWSIGV